MAESGGVAYRTAQDRSEARARMMREIDLDADKGVVDKLKARVKDLEQTVERYDDARHADIDSLCRTVAELWGRIESLEARARRDEKFAAQYAKARAFAHAAQVRQAEEDAVWAAYETELATLGS